MSTRYERLAGRDLDDDAVHVDVAREIEIETLAADLRPRQRFLITRVVDRIALDHRHFALADPVAIEVALEPSAAADVLRAVLRILGVGPGLRFLLSECRCRQQRNACAGRGDLLHERPTRARSDAQLLDEVDV